MTLLERLAARTCALAVADIGPRGVDLIRTGFADTVAVALAGSSFDGAALVREAAGITPAPRGSLILGTAGRAGALDAGLLNGIAAHALDYDDSNLTLTGHPSALLVPAILALGEETGASAAEALLAYAAGYEVMIRVARGVNLAHYVRGWHPTATIGVIGVAAAGAKLLGLDAARTATAMAVAVSGASGIKANFGTMTKSFHVGQAVRDGLLAAKLARAGFTASADALEAPQGFLNVYNGSAGHDAGAIVAGLTAASENPEPAVNTEVNPVKAYACCHSTHGAVEAARSVRNDQDFDLGKIMDVEIIVDEKRMPHTDRPVLADALAGKFSLQYVVARALAYGTVGLADFAGDAHRDPAVAGLMGRTKVTAGTAGNSFGATVRVRAGGREIEATGQPSGGGQPSWDKVRDCAGQVLDPAAVSSLVDALREFPSLPVRDLAALAEVAR